MSDPKLIRGFGLLQATALNMSNMIGVGPFITIPLLLAAMNGPQAMLGWLVGALIAIADGLIWSELGAAMPGSGGSYVYLREAYGRETFGRMMAFLFIWQFILSGPLEIASGCIGFAQYTQYLLPHITPMQMKLIAAGVGVLAVILLYRKITSIGKLTVTLWAGTLFTMLAIILGGLPFFNSRLAFDFPPGAFDLNWGFFSGLGMSTLLAIYAYLGYYDVCYIGDEVKNPGRVIPRSIIYSLLALAVLYIALNIIIVGVLPWQEAKDSKFIVSDYIHRIYGSRMAAFVTLMILWTAVGSVVALLLGYSRVPYAAALDGHFFSPFAKVHPQKKLPHVSLIVLGIVSVVSSFLNLADVISALMATRIIVQFMGQILAITRLRQREPYRERPYKMWLYPLPSVIAFAGWSFVFASTGRKFILLGLGTLVLGVLAFLLWSWRTKRWPFAPPLSVKTPVQTR